MCSCWARHADRSYCSCRCHGPVVWRSDWLRAKTEMRQVDVTFTVMADSPEAAKRAVEAQLLEHTALRFEMGPED